MNWKEVSERRLLNLTSVISIEVSHRSIEYYLDNGKSFLIYYESANEAQQQYERIKQIVFRSSYLQPVL